MSTYMIPVDIMAHPTFHPFPRLPKELRDLIWDAAIRPDVPSAHFFTTWHGDQRNAVRVILTSALTGYVSRAWEGKGSVNLAASRWNKAHPMRPAWFENNPSVYRDDGGLWTACCESREAMIRRFGSRAITSQTITGTLVQHGRRQYFTVRPDTDLFCTQPAVLLHDLLSWNRLPNGVPFFNNNNGPRQHRHIALELDTRWIDYDPLLKNIIPIAQIPVGYPHMRWFRERGRSELRCLLRAASNDLGRWADRLWFIDYRIRRNRNAEPLVLQDGQTVFNGRGCNPAGDTEPDWIWGNDRLEDNMHHFFELQHFIDLLKEWTEPSLGLGLAPPMYDFFDINLARPKLGFLACIPDSDLKGLVQP
ncbi:hypothetical protein F4778DRAFT_798419 [Xylariomycetidae sp. FL2044]|nr:hypothetical protein F4778DRAFT_798419 [Xylariomycetidae sp. FL2044]